IPRRLCPSSPGAAQTSPAPAANHHGIIRKYDERRKSAASAGIFVVKILDGLLLTLRRPAILTLIIALTSIFSPAAAQDPPVRLGIDTFLREPAPLRGRAV